MRVAVVAGPAAGHTFPAAGLAFALRDAGHRVVLLTGRGWLSALRRDGLDARLLPAIPEDRPHDSFAERIYSRAGAMVPSLAALLREDPPDLVVHDTLTLVGAWAADLVGLPRAELVPHPLQLPSAHLPPPGMGLAPAHGRTGRLRDVVLRRITAPAVRLGERQRADARSALELGPDPGPIAVLVATLPALELPRPDWPDGAHVVGPLGWDPAAEDLRLPSGDRPLAFLSASTAGGGATTLLETAVAGLHGVRVAETRLAPYAGRPLPAWAVSGPGRQAPVLAAASVVVAGAGHGIVAKSLQAGRPLVLLPGPGEQHDNANRVRRLGAGVVLPPQRLRPDRLRAAVEQVLEDPSYAAAARRAAERSAHFTAADAVAVLERAMAGASHE